MKAKPSQTKETVRNFKRYRRILWSIFGACVGFVVLLFCGIGWGLFGFMPSFEDLENPTSSLSSEIISSDQEILGAYYIENRTNVEFNELSPYLVQALIATEDSRFYNHSGVDLRSLGRVFFKSILRGDRSGGGGSTITQQLAKNLFPRKELSKMGLAVRKLKEWVIAAKLERNYTKDEIIAMYFNTVDFGNNAYGIKIAAATYFGKLPGELAPEEAAVLVGMLKATSYYNPLRNPQNATNRRNVVFSQMRKAGFLNQSEYEELCAKPIDMSHFSRQNHEEGLATHFREYLRQYLTQWCKEHKKPDGKPYDLYRDGLKIYTTINSRMQRHAEEAVAEWIGGTLQNDFYKDVKGSSRYAPFSADLTREEVNKFMEQAMKNSDRYRAMKKAGASDEDIKKAFHEKVAMKVFTWQGGEKDTVMSPWDSLWYHKWFLHCGLMSVEPQTGYVRAYVGDISYKYFKYDNVSQGRRQVGSTFKPFVYTLAMQEGEFKPCTQVPNVPVCFPLPDGEEWCPANSSSKREGEMVSLRWALANSVNFISAYLIKRFPPEAVINLTRRMGITAPMEAVPSICLGTMDISVREMASAMSTYANQGIHIDPIFITRIEDKHGIVIENFAPHQEEAMSAKTAYLMLDLMKGVVDEGSAGRLRWRYGLKMPIAGKTGTTQNHSDAWFMGITPTLTTGIWVGGELRSIHFNSMRLGQGANAALPVWGIYMKKIYEDEELAFPQDDFEKPEGVDAELRCKDEKRVPVSEEEEPEEEQVPVQDFPSEDENLNSLM
ncbi:MAG: penicillin-binding protein [Bacteroides sp.]|nr:penicillin-binding protein [Ruminococcus flavefaciens]MCM1554707.1 penicillin-binding protein [Bacteroides sp.]